MASVQELLQTFGIGHRYLGNAVLKQALELALEDESRLCCVSRRLYPLICQRVNCSQSTIERNIRTVITHVWQTHADKLIEIADYELIQPPTVTEFLDILTTHLMRTSPMPSA